MAVNSCKIKKKLYYLTSCLKLHLSPFWHIAHELELWFSVLWFLWLIFIILEMLKVVYHMLWDNYFSAPICCHLTNNSVFANDSPMQTLLPVPNGLKLGGIPVNLPSASRNRDGSNLLGSFQCLSSCSSSWRFGQTWVPFGIVYSPWLKTGSSVKFNSK